VGRDITLVLAVVGMTKDKGIPHKDKDKVEVEGSIKRMEGSKGR
jgi:hypothetical protein